MKVLFLDIDGVLNSRRSATAFGGYPWDFDEKGMSRFDMVAFRLIQKLVKETGCKIVLSSTWRIGRTIEETSKGLDVEVIGHTPQLSACRGEEIKEWLSLNKVDKYAIVDDDGDMLDEQKPFFVQTNPIEGLSYINYDHLLHLLG